ncbi:MAG TPA: 50S ribosome-binding GTPase [Phycisphaerae bacterium]|nr:50S ribosome-binding GTPase [Phycisphaerae bacterium]HXK84825.1 50S ribosome-binding GTPase [Phycisphaerae bacterium]
MSTQTRNELTTAACLTPPAAGGIAVIQVVGPRAPAVVNPLLKGRRPIDVSRLEPDELRFCQIVDRGEVLDDVLVASRRSPDGVYIIDINLHGGSRIVQRVLLALKAAGAAVIETTGQPAANWPVENHLEQEAIALLARAKTRAVASWLVRAPGALAAAAGEIERQIADGRHEAARAALADLVHHSVEARYLIDGVRVVLTGEPNSGKSTLANALAGVEHSLVSQVPGTTRDWVELPAAIEGLPITLVDTAGVRDTDDPLERESIRRAHRQVATADVVVHVVDRSAPPREPAPPPSEKLTGREAPDPSQKAGQPSASPDSECDPAGAEPEGDWPRRREPACLRVWNKSDLPPHPAHGVHEAAGEADAGRDTLAVSGLTGQGLAELRLRILAAVEMTDWAARPARLYTRRQEALCRKALAALAGHLEADPSPALRALAAPMHQLF